MLMKVLAKTHINLDAGLGVPDQHYHLTLVMPGLGDLLQLVLETGYGTVSVTEKQILWTINKRDFLHMKKVSNSSLKQLLEFVNV